MRLGRRDLLRLAFAAAAGSALGCGEGDYGEADEAALARQRADEAARSGRGPHGVLRFRGYRGLAELPWFELDEAKRLRLVLDEPPAGIDLHTHLAMWMLFAPAVDLLRRTGRVSYRLDCDAEEPGCPLDLDVYLNANFTAEALADLRRELRDQLWRGSEASHTYTIPNLLEELDRMGFEQAAVLPIAWGLPFGDDLTAAWLDALGRARARPRLVPFASVHPRDGGWPEKLRGYAARGVRGVKLHPEMQRFYPDDPEAMAIYAECEQLDLPVIFHAGRSGIEPRFLRRYAVIRRYEAPVAEFPGVRFLFGHAGARDAADALRLARERPNVWLEIAGQGVSALHRMLEDLGPKRLVFGSDWPFYPLAATLAKLLIVTEGRPEARRAILRENALALLRPAAGLASASAGATGSG